jgi:2-dehydropantoate 2-reductase
VRIAVLGSGGIGGYLGALLAGTGHDVVLIARGAHLEAMQRAGLTVRTPAGESTLPVTATADTGAVGPVDLVLFCVKSYDTEPAAQALKPLIGRDTAVLTFQNGVDSVDAIASVVGHDTVLAGVVYVATQLVGPGVILRTGAEARIAFGEPRGALTERVRRLGDVFTRSRIPNEISTDIQRALWEKFLFIAAVGGVTALARSPIGPILPSSEGRILLTASASEIVAVAHAVGVRFPANAVDAVLTQAATVPPHWRSSMARDLEDGRRLEVEALSGAVVRRGREHGVPTPVHQAIAACLALHQPEAAHPLTHSTVQA